MRNSTFLMLFLSCCLVSGASASTSKNKKRHKKVSSTRVSELSVCGLQQKILNFIEDQRFDQKETRKFFSDFVQTFSRARSNYIQEINDFVKNDQIRLQYLFDADAFLRFANSSCDLSDLLGWMLAFRNFLFFKEAGGPIHFAYFFNLFGLSDETLIREDLFESVFESHEFKRRCIDQDHEPLHESFLYTIRQMPSYSLLYPKFEAIIEGVYSDFFLLWYPYPLESEALISSPSSRYLTCGNQVRLLKIPVGFDDDIDSTKLPVKVCQSLIARSKPILEEVESLSYRLRGISSSPKLRKKLKFEAVLNSSRTLFCYHDEDKLFRSMPLQERLYRRTRFIGQLKEYIKRSPFELLLVLILPKGAKSTKASVPGDISGLFNEVRVGKGALERILERIDLRTSTGRTIALHHSMAFWSLFICTLLQLSRG